MFVPARRFDPEWMDRPDNSPDDLNGALDDIRESIREMTYYREHVFVAAPVPAPDSPVV